MPPPRSPLAPARFPEIPAVPGVRMAARAAGLRYLGRPDLALFELAAGTTVAGLLTRSKVPGHPVVWCRRILPRGRARGLVVNAGNANVLVGEAGDAAVRAEAETTAALLGAEASEVLVASTGVIGEPLPVAKITAALPRLHAGLTATAWREAAEAICTTDTFPKGAFASTRIGDAEVTIAGIAKGSGMIQPDMATMLAFLFTDAALPPAILQPLLEAACARSFHAITVDSDTSTSDTLLLFATGQTRHPVPRGPDDPLLDGFRVALEQVAGDLARQVVRDGEGAAKLIAITVEGAIDDGSARRIGLAIANSPLVKTAIAGADANWGRIVMAVGKAGEPIELGQLAISFGGHAVAQAGARVPDLDEAPVAAHLKGREIEIAVVVGRGPGAATVWTCDLTHGYIAINADYRS
ncbi:MAG: bifunctional glutamate N-acetyltransferase/amino-acid acetyltransferase ArgJ [Geminicoccaceae bacterium]